MRSCCELDLQCLLLGLVARMTCGQLVFVTTTLVAWGVSLWREREFNEGKYSITSFIQTKPSYRLRMQEHQSPSCRSSNSPCGREYARSSPLQEVIT